MCRNVIIVLCDIFGGDLALGSDTLAVSMDPFLSVGEVRATYLCCLLLDSLLWLLLCFSMTVFPILQSRLIICSIAEFSCYFFPVSLQSLHCLIAVSLPSLYCFLPTSSVNLAE